ncbi:MAG: YegS/Rv2252/BmrU family lipid kinase [Erysipelotrichaceae bacterium]|nr:YegS/Rv2252/BmrU family lipid kinase [Erysipelotrichaceae bacterium]
MKHLIICNTHAGHGKDAKELALKAFEGLDFEIYETVDQRSAISFLRNYFKDHKELTRVYACGGDGTLHEVVNGLVGVKNAELALYACGTGNDFAKVYGGKDKFLDFKKLIHGNPTPIDLTKLEGPSMKEPWYSINVINFGFDAIVGAKGNENKKKGIKDPYGFTHAIVPAILHGRFNKATITADGEDLNGKKFLLGSVSQGQFVGGEWHAAPKSNNTDGLLDVCVAKTMTFLGLMTKLFGAYHDGKHIDNPKLKKKVIYRRSKEVTIVAPSDIDLCVDGEMIRGNNFKCTIVPQAIKFVIPEE